MKKTTAPHSRQASTQHFLHVADIKDNVLILRNAELRQVLQVTALNFALKSDQEQAAIVYQYQAFLNSLQFPVQIVIQSRQLDLTNYLNDLQRRLNQADSLLIRNQIADYIDFISQLTSLGSIMEKQFYVVVPLATSAIRARSFFGQLFKRETIAVSDQDFTAAKAKLVDRVELIRVGLASIGLLVRPLTSDEMIRLLYSTYNPIGAGEIAAPAQLQETQGLPNV